MVTEGKRFIGYALALALGAALAGPARAQNIPALIDAQGMVRDSAGNPINGTADLVFKIYNVPTGGIPLYTETQPGVQLNGGIFSTQLGRISSLPLATFLETSLYVEIVVGGQTLSPRQQFVTAPYAMNAQYVQSRDLTYFLVKDVATGFWSMGASPPSAFLHVKKSGSGIAGLVDNSSSNGTVLSLAGAGNGASLSLGADSIFSSGALNIGNGQNTVLRTDLGGQVLIGGTSGTTGVTLEVLSGNAAATRLCLGADCRTQVPDCQTAASCPSGYTPVASATFGSSAGPFFCCRP